MSELIEFLQTHWPMVAGLSPLTLVLVTWIRHRSLRRVHYKSRDGTELEGPSGDVVPLIRALERLDQASFDSQITSEHESTRNAGAPKTPSG